MKDEIRYARDQEAQTSRLATQARSARERLDGFRARTDGPEVSSDSELRKLEQESELADERLRRAQTMPAEAATDEDTSGQDDEDDSSGEGGELAWLT
jgi:hypothetical protein